MTESKLFKKIFKMIDESGLPISDDSEITTDLEKRLAKLIDDIYQELYDFMELEDL